MKKIFLLICISFIGCAIQTKKPFNFVSAPPEKQATVLFVGFVTNNNLETITREIREEFMETIHEKLQNIPNYKYVYFPHGKCRNKKSESEINLRETIGLALTITRAGRIDYWSLGNVHSKYFLTISLNSFDPITGQNLDMFAETVFCNNKEERKSIDKKYDKKIFNQLIWSVTNSIIKQVQNRFTPCIDKLIAKKINNANYLLNIGKEQGILENMVLYNNNNKPFIVTEATKDFSKLLFQGNDLLELTSKETLFLKKTRYSFENGFPFNAQILTIYAPQNSPKVVDLSLATNVYFNINNQNSLPRISDIVLNCATEINKIISSHPKLRLLYPVPCDIGSKSFLIKQASEVKESKDSFLQKRIRPDFAIIGRILYAHRNEINQPEKGGSILYYKVKVAVDIVDCFNKMLPLYTTYAEADFSETETNYKKVDDYGVYASLCKTAFQKASKKFLENYKGQNFHSKLFLFDGVNIENQTKNNQNLNQMCYQSVTTSEKAPLVFTEDCRTALRKITFFKYFKDSSFVSSQVKYEKLKSQFIENRQVNISRNINFKFHDTLANNNTISFKAILKATSDKNVLWEVPIKGVRKSKTDPDLELKEFLLNACSFSGIKLKKDNNIPNLTTEKK